MKWIRKWGYIFIAPVMSLFLVFTVIPLVWSIIMSLQRFGIWEVEWVGLQNFRDLFAWRDFYIALSNTSIYAAVFIGANMFFALGLASLIFPLSNKAQTFFRAAFYLPRVTSAVVLALVWAWMFNPSFGLLNQILVFFGLPAQPWLTSPGTALWSIIFSQVVAMPGAGIILFLAAMGNIPETFYEAASLDGASEFKKWWHITVPLVKPTALYLMVMYTITGFRVFAQMFVMTRGGPGTATISLTLLIYNTAFRDFNFGLASALAMVVFAILAILSIVQFKVLSPRTARGE